MKPPSIPGRRPGWTRTSRVLICSLIVAAGIAFSGPAESGFAQQEMEHAPATGDAKVIAQGVVALPPGDVIWRVVRDQAGPAAGAVFVERPLGFVLATTDPVLLTDESGNQSRLGIGEAALVREGTVQRRDGLAESRVSYLAIELVPADAPPPAEDAIVLYQSEPFPAPSGLRDLDLLGDGLRAGETLSIPGTGAASLALVTAGAVGFAPSGADLFVLLAGESASFSGEAQVSVATDDGASGDDASLVVALIGPEVSPLVSAAGTPAPETAPGVPPGGAPSDAAAGSISIQVSVCPRGMSSETLDPAACAPIGEDFAVTIAGEPLDVPLSLGDAEVSETVFTWSGLPFGDYTIFETALPGVATTYFVSASDGSGSPGTGYRVTLDPEHPDLQARIYNFTTE